MEKKILKEEKMVKVSVASERAEAIGGILVAFFAALMAVAGVINGNYEEEMMIAHSRHSTYSNWYQAKSIKQDLKENELVLLETIVKDSSKTIQRRIQELKDGITLYELEKKEILFGSEKVGKQNWVQDLDGEYGKIIGLKALEKIATKYDEATKKFDIAMLFYQICIVLGAVCVIIYDNPKLQKSFIALMLLFGGVGIVFSVLGFIL